MNSFRNCEAETYKPSYEYISSVRAIILAVVLVFAQSVNAPSLADVNVLPFKVGFIMNGPLADHGWNCAHDQGRRFLESTMKDKVQVTVAENIPENSQVERVMEKMIAQGCKLIFATSYGYLEPALKVASRHPDVDVMQCCRSVPAAKNVGAYFVNLCQPLYIAGVVAGRVTKSGKIGCVAAHPVNTVLATLNAFAIGVHSVNPKAHVQVIWTNSWFDPATESEATKGLIDAGVDVVFSEVSSAATIVQTAEKNGVRSSGCCVDVRGLAPKGWLTGQCFNWGPLYLKTVKSILDHSWKPGDRIYEMKDGYSNLASFGSMVPESVKKEALTIKKNIEDGKVVVFKGPLKDSTGKERIAPGKNGDSDYLLQMDWVVSGIDGSVPKK